jgi:hypothetical protein
MVLRCQGPLLKGCRLLVLGGILLVNRAPTAAVVVPIRRVVAAVVSMMRLAVMIAVL